MPADPPTTRPRHDRTLRDRLREEATAVLAREGPAALSLRRIATAAGTSTTAIYSLFGSKEELVRSICWEGSRQLADAMRSVQRTADPVADVESLGQAYRRWALSAPNTYQVMFGGVMPELELTEDDRATMRDGLDHLGKAVARCIETGAYQSADPAATALVLWGLVHGLVSLELTELAEADNSGERFSRALEMATRGLGGDELGAGGS